MLVSTRQNPHALVHRSPSNMNVAVPSAQHSDRFGHPASSHTVTRPSERIVRLRSSTSAPWRTFGRSHSGLRVLIDRPSATPAASRRERSRTGVSDRAGLTHGPGAGAARERREIAGAVPPRDVLTLGRAVAPAFAGEPGEHVDHLAERDVEPLLSERRDGTVGNPARHDVFPHVREVGGDVEGETVHRAPALQADTDGADLARVRSGRVDPHTRVFVEPAGIDAEGGERVDDELLDVADVAARTDLVPDPDDRVADQLSGPVVRDVAATAHRDEVGADVRRVATQVGVRDLIAARR